MLQDKYIVNYVPTGMIPFYLVQEGLFDGSVPKIEPRIGPVKIVELARSDVPALASKPRRDHSREDILEMLSKGCVCLVVKHKGDIAACMWYDLRECSYTHLKFTLADDEGYLYSARTFDAYRGKALAPFLRQQIYERLAAVGRTKLYSITLFENTPSMMFKKKLNARNLKLYLRYGTHDQTKWMILLKSYKPPLV